MANQRLTDATCRKLKCPEGRRSKIYFDSQVPGLGLRVTAAGARSFTFSYRTRGGRDRCTTIGSIDEWSVSRFPKDAEKNARARAKELKRDIDLGKDPQGDLADHRKAPTVADLCERFLEEHGRKLRPSTLANYKAFIENDIKPSLGAKKVAEVSYSDIDRLHRKISTEKRSRNKKGSPYVANRVAALLSKMFALSIRWHMCTDNPCKGLERNQEIKRERYLSSEERARLSAALDELNDQRTADLIRTLMLTGARRGEVLSMQWSQIKDGVWTKPGHTTKQKTVHRVPLSEDALAIINRQPRDALYVFPGSTGQRKGLRKSWSRVTKRAGLEELRIHDLRHDYASSLASSGLSLPIIGRMLGHTQAQTTARYAHLLDEPLKAAAEIAAAAIKRSPGPGNIVPFKTS